MPDIDTAFVRQFEDDIYVELQQSDSRLMPYVKERPITGTKMYINRLGPVEVRKKTQRFQPTILSDAPHSRRELTITDYDQALGLDREDEIRLTSDFTGEYVSAMSMGLARQIDRDILIAAEGDSISVDADLVGTIIQLPASQIIGPAGTNFTLDKLREAAEKFDAAEVPVMGRYLAWNASAKHNLLKDVEVTSSDFNTIKALVNGEINTYLGFEFVLTELVTGTGTAQAQMIAFHDTVIVMGVGARLKINIDLRKDLSYAKQIFAAGTFGMVRMEEKKVVRIDCVQA